MTKVLVTGGAGFAGRHLVTHLTERGDEVVVADRTRDITTSEIDAAISDSRPSVIFHLAAMSSVARSWTHPHECTLVNVVGTRNVLDAAWRHVPHARIVVISTAEVYGVVRPDEVPLRESSPLRPANPYATSKVEAENCVHDAQRERDQHVVIARPFTHTGPGQSDQFVVPAFATRLLDAAENATSDMAVGDLSARRDFTDVRDVVRAYRLLALFGVSGQVYNVARGHDVSIADVASELRDMIWPSAQFVVDPSLLRPVEVPVLRGDASALHAATGWEPEIAWSTTLSDIVTELRQRRAALKLLINEEL